MTLENGRYRVSNARIARYVPYTELLPHTAVMVTNGGYGGVKKSGSRSAGKGKKSASKKASNGGYGGVKKSSSRSGRAR